MTRRRFARQRHETEGFVYRKRCFHCVILWRWWVIAKVFLVSQMTATTTRGRNETPTVAGTCDGDAAFVLCLSVWLRRMLVTATSQCGVIQMEDALSGQDFLSLGKADLSRRTAHRFTQSFDCRSGST